MQKVEFQIKKQIFSLFGILPLEREFLECYAQKSLVYSLLWAFAGDCSTAGRNELSNFLRDNSVVQMPVMGTLSECEVCLPQAEWSLWSSRVPVIDVESHRIGSSDVIIPTVDTVRHETLVYNMLAERRPLILCGPPGSGKTMTLLCSLRALADIDVVSLNFSSASTPELLIKSLLQYCDIRKTSKGYIMSPSNPGRWLVLMCDEINLPDYDQYGTQRIISFIRGILEQSGFYHTVNRQFITLERVQFVGACNPPTDPGRKPLSPRFLRHVTVLYVDYAGEKALHQIYGTFCQSILKVLPLLHKYWDSLTSAMIEFYIRTQDHLTVDMQPHYIYSPRELTRWVRGISEAVRNQETLSYEGLVRIWGHEALRLFHDRLVRPEDREWTIDLLMEIAHRLFASADIKAALEFPILFSNWLTKDYLPTDRTELQQYVQARLKIFHEEELDVPLVLYDDLLDHILRIDRVFRQPQGHLLLIGISGSGKTTSARFVAWINGIKVVTLKVHNNYTMANFDEDLRSVLRRCGCKKEKIAFIVDEDSLLEPSFLERMNTLLANGEIPGLFEGGDYVTLISQCKEAAQRDGMMIDTQDELYRWFASEVIRNLHIVITMSDDTLKDKASTSPALFNRCVINWVGDWSDHTLSQVASNVLQRVDLSCSQFVENSGESHWIVDDVIDCFVHFHRRVQSMQKRLVASGLAGQIVITPRHFIDFLEQFILLFNNKRSKTEEHQLHVGIGLRKIQETVDQIEELRIALSTKRNSLETKNKAAGEKLQEMVRDQQEAEKQKVTSEEVKSQLSKQTNEMSIKTDAMRNDLDKVEPALLEAKHAVQSIKKQHLIELRSLREPPAQVKLTSECICLIMGQEASDWKTIRSFLCGDGFINSIVHFKTESIRQQARDRIRTKYLSNSDFTFEKVSKGSQVCGPLYKWAIAQLEYSEMLNRVGPMRAELTELQARTEVNRARLNELDSHITSLENNISRYKVEYAQLVSEAQETNRDLQTVEAKVSRSIALLRSLEYEQARWKDSTEVYIRQMNTLVGDVLLCSAFLAYAGYFDQVTRDTLWMRWRDYLDIKHIDTRTDLNNIEFLSNPDERLDWIHHGLPGDQLCTENAIMLNSFVRYPLIIDPSNVAVSYLMKKFENRKIVKTSFQDESFRKQLESSMRFGNPLVIQDVESYDPLLNPLLNKELHKISGRVLIRIGNQDIDFSPSFIVFLITRDPTINLTPNLCSKVTIVNFTVTQMSMEAQCLQKVLLHEKPEAEKRRNNLTKLQGEFQQKLRKLEDKLLEALNEQQGRILDDDSVIAHLEALKLEASEIQIKAEQADEVMKEIETSNNFYGPLCQACASIYFLLQSLSQMHYFYQYSLNFVMCIFDDALNSVPPVIDSPISPDQSVERLNIMVEHLFVITMNRVTPSLLRPGPQVLGVMLAQIYCNLGFNGRKSISESINEMIEFENLDQNKIGVDKPNVNIPSKTNLEPLERMVWTHMNLPHQMLSACETFINDTFAASFFDPANSPVSSEHLLNSLITKELNCYTPVLFCSSTPGYDQSDKVFMINPATQSIAMGSIESCVSADAMLNACSKTGKWLLLRNVHLSISWLNNLEKKLHSLRCNDNFRLFLSMQMNPDIPSNLIRMSRVIMFEPAAGVLSNVHTVINSVVAERVERRPRERCVLYLALCWLHSTILERLRYVPVGWSKVYDFNESDLKFSSDVIDYWVDLVASDRNNIQPDRIPWDALVTLIVECIYGGRIDNPFDKRTLTSFVRQFFNPRLFTDDEFKFVRDVELTKRPDALSNRADLIEWISRISQTADQSPMWIGLSQDADKKLLVNLGNNPCEEFIDDFSNS